MASDASRSPLVGRLHADFALARQAAFALFVLLYLEQIGLAPRRLLPEKHASTTPLGRRARANIPLDMLPDMVAGVLAQNPYVLAAFQDAGMRESLRTLDPVATQEMVGWLASQHVDQEPPQIAYELGMLALGIELPGILVRGLRELTLAPDSRVVELPDGAGYPTVFLSTLHPQWQAASHARLYVHGTDATQLAGWAMLLLSGQLGPPPDSIVPVGDGESLPVRGTPFDVAIVYNPAPWLRVPAVAVAAIPARSTVFV